MKEVKATLKNLNIAPRKVRLVADVIRGMHVTGALAQLDVMSNRSTNHIAKLIQSAMANARERKMDVSNLVIKSINVDHGVTLKRSLPRSRGRATLIRKRMSHVTLKLEESESVNAPKFVVPEKQKKVKEHKESRKAAPKPKPKQQEEGKGKKKGRKGFGQKMFRRKSI